jgi:hypothetical protein
MSNYQSASPRLSVELLHEFGRLASHPLREVGRLEHEAQAGETATAPAILLAGIAIIASMLGVLVFAIVLGFVALVGG